MKSFLAKLNGDATFLSRVTKCLTTAAISLATLLITGSAWAVDAPVPVAVWSGDFGIVEKTGTDNQTYTLSSNGNTVSDDGTFITIDGTKAVKVDWSGAQVAEATIIVRYSDLKASTVWQMLASTTCDSYTDGCGVFFKKSSESNKLSGWGRTGYYSGNTAMTFPDAGVRKSFALIHDSDSAPGTALYHNNSGTWTQGYSNTGLRWNTDNIHGFNIGGMRGDSTTCSPATGMQISAIAIFKKCLSTDEIAAFKWVRNWTATDPGDWSNAANWEGGVVPQNGDTAIIPAGAVVNVDSAAVSTGVTVQGAGRIIFTNWDKIPTGSWTKPEWKGTLELKNVTKTSGCKLDWLGNAESSICFNGFTGYAFSIPNDANYPLATFKNVEIGEDGLTVTGNFSSSTFSSINGNLVGAGTITMSATCGKKESGYEFVGDPSGFSGSVNVSNGSGANMNVGFETERKTDYSLTGNRQIVVGEGVTVGIGEDKTWTASNGVHVYGTITGAGTIAGATTLGATAVLKPTNGWLKITGVLTAGSGITIDASAIDVSDGADWYPLVSLASALSDEAVTVNEIRSDDYEKGITGTTIGLKKKGLAVVSSWAEFSTAVGSGAEKIVVLSAITDGGSNTATLKTDTEIELRGDITGGTIANGGFGLTFNVAEDHDSTISCVISGEGAVRKIGNGMLLMSGRSTFSGGMTISKGIVKNCGTLGGTKSTSNGEGIFGTAETVVVEDGGAFDFNGQGSVARGFKKFSIAGEGYNGSGAILNSGTSMGWNYAEVHGIILADDALIGAGSGEWICNTLNAGNSLNTFDLKGHTLTIAIAGQTAGDKGFLTANSKFIGAGTIRIAKGGLVEIYSSSVNMADAKLDVKEGGVLYVRSSATLNLSDVVTCGTIDNRGVLSIAGELDCSNLALSTTPISGNLAIVSTTTFKFPLDLEENSDYSLCTATLSGATSGVRYAYVKGQRRLVNLEFNGNSVSYSIAQSAEMDGEKYETVAAAVAVAGDAEKTIKLLVDTPEVLDIPENITIDRNGKTFGGITGSGIIIYDGALPSAADQNCFKAETWTGTVWLKNITSWTAWFNVNLYGNLSSKVAITGFNGYFAVPGAGGGQIAKHIPEVVLIDDGNTAAITIGNGSSGAGNEVNFSKFSGSGTLTSVISGVGQKYVVNDASEFTGSITMVGGKGLTIGDEKAAGDNQILIAANKVARIGSENTWTADGGIIINGTLCGAGTLASATTFGENSSVVASLDGALTITGTITGKVKIDGSAIDEAETKPNYTKVLTATAETKPACELIGVEGYDLVWKGDDLYAVDSAKRALYKQFSYANAIYTWRGTGEIANNNALYYILDPDFGEDQGTVDGTDYFKGKTDYKTIPGCAGADNRTFWCTFAYSSSVAGFNAPGNVLRFVQSDTYGKTIGATFGPLTFGGLIVEKGATGYGFNNGSNGTRSNAFGDPTGSATTYYVINEDFKINRSGQFYLMGDLVFEVAEGKTFDLNFDQNTANYNPIIYKTVAVGASGNFGTATAGGSLTMKGAGTLKVRNLTASGATLDYSNLELGRESAFIEGNLTVDKDTTFMFPEGFEPTSEEKPSSFKLCSDTISGPEKIIGANIYVGGVKLSGKELLFDLQNGTVSYQDISSQRIPVTEDISITGIEGKVTSGYTGIVELDFESDGLALVIDKAIPFSNIILECDGLVTLAAGAADDAYVPVADDFNKINWNDVSVANKRIYRNIAPFGTAPTAGMTYRYEGTKALATIPFVSDSFAGTIEVDCPIATNSGELMLAGNKNIVFGSNFSATVAGCVSFGGSGNIVQTITQNGGTLTANREGDGGSCGNSAFIPARYPVPVTYDLLGGTFSAPNGQVQYWDGTPTINIGGGSALALFTAKGIHGTDKNNTSVVNVLNKGTLEIGAGGVAQSASNKIVLNGGTYKATATHSISGGTLELAANSTFDVAGDATLTMAPTTISGSGSITKIGAGTLKFDNSHLFYGSQINTGTELVITGGTLDLNNAYTWSNDGSGFLTQKPITLGSATTIKGGNVTFYDSSITDSIIYDGGENSVNEPAEFAANWHGSYSPNTYSRNINVGKGAGRDYDLLISGTFGIRGGDFAMTEIHKTGEGTAMMTGEFNMPKLFIDAGTWKMGAAKSVPITTAVNASGTLDVNGQTVTIPVFTSVGKIVNSSENVATINIPLSTTISGEIGNNVTIVSQGGVITIQDGTCVDDEVKFVVDLDESVVGSTPFVFADVSLYSKVTTKGDGSALSYNTTTHKIVYGGKKLSDTMIWLPIGDSITEGEQYMGHPGQGNEETRGGYRYQLYSQLTDAGMSVRSVGYRTGHMETVEQDDCPWAWHAAQYGGAIAYDANAGTHSAALFNVENTLQVAGYPDVITVLLGVNDLSFNGATKEGVYDSMDAMVKKLAKMRPNSKILVSTLLPSVGKDGAGRYREDYINPYNDLLRTNSNAKASPFNLSNVKLVDVNEKMEPYANAYFKGDHLHPNEVGSIRVAGLFMGFMATAIGEIVDGDTKMVHVHNGESGKIIVRFSKALDENATATLTITGTDVDGQNVNVVFENGAVDTTDKRVMRFAIPENTTLKGGVYTATLSEIDTAELSSDFVEIQGTGAEANIDKAYRKDFQRYGTVTFSDGTPIPEDGIGLGDNWQGNGPKIEDVNEELEGVDINRVGYYIELKRENEPSQFVWVSMDAFSTSLPDLLVPTAEVGAHKAKVANLQVYANRANVTNTEINNGVVDTTQTGVVEFTPWSWTGADQNGYINDIYSGKTGWNDTLETAAGTLKGGMQVFHYTGETTDKYTKFAAETVFAVNNFNCDTAMDLGIGSFSAHRSNAGGSAAIAPTWDWSNFVSQSKYKKFAVNAYEVKKMEIWVVPMSEITWIGNGDDNNWNTKKNWNTGTVPASYSDVIIPTGATIELNDDVTIARLNEDASASITGDGSIKVSNLAASTLKGVATIVFDGALPDAAVRTQLKSADWKGTAWLKDIGTWNNFDFENYGNAGSKIKVTGVAGFGPDSTDKGVNSKLILADSDDTKAILINNGYSNKSYYFSKVSGSGTFGWDRSKTKGPNSGQTYVFKDVSGFDGTFDSGAFLKIVVGDTTAGSDKGSITFADGIAVKAGLGWTAQKAYFGATIAVEGSLGDVLVSGLTAAPGTLPGLLDAEGNDVEDLALAYEAGVGGAPNVIKLVAAGAKTDSGKSYATIEEAINSEETPTIKVAENAAPLEIENIAANKTFKLADDTSKENFDWTESSTKYIALTAAGLTVKGGTPANQTFTGEGATKKLVALGLDASDANDKPYLKAEQNESTTTVKFNFFHGTAVNGIINPTGIGGLTVKYAVEYADSADFSTGTDTTEPTTTSSVSVDLPTTGTKTRYYRPKFSFGN